MHALLRAILPHSPAILNAMSRMLEEIRQQPEALERTLSSASGC